MTLLSGVNTSLFFLIVFVVGFFSAIRGIAVEIFLEDTFCFSLRTQMVAFMVEARFPRTSFEPLLVVYLFRDMSGDAASSATAAAAGEVLIPGMAQAPLVSLALVTTSSLNAPGSQPHFMQFSDEEISAAPPMDPSRGTPPQRQSMRAIDCGLQGPRSYRQGIIRCA